MLLHRHYHGKLGHSKGALLILCTCNKVWILCFSGNWTDTFQGA